MLSILTLNFIGKKGNLGIYKVKPPLDHELFMENLKQIT